MKARSFSPGNELLFPEPTSQGSFSNQVLLFLSPFFPPGEWRKGDGPEMK
jgi:hypothetical protein